MLICIVFFFHSKYLSVVVCVIFFFSFHLSIPKLSPKSESVVDKIINQKSSFFLFLFFHFQHLIDLQGNHNHCEKILVTLFAFHLFFWSKKGHCEIKKAFFLLFFFSLYVFLSRKRIYPILWLFFNTHKQGG